MTNIKELFPIVGVGIGPGDPDMITLKGYKALKAADTVYYPVSKLDANAELSYSRAIIDAYELTADCKPLLFPMTGKNREQFYQDAFEVVCAERNLGKKVAIVSEGDLLFYSTFGYLLTLFNESAIPTELISGIPAFILGGAAAQKPLTEGDESIEVLARPKSYEQIEEHFSRVDVMVIMKMKVLKDWYNFLSKANLDFFYAEKLGTSEQYTTSAIEDLKDREIPYFSILILKKRK